MDFFSIQTRSVKGGASEIYPNFLVKRADDLMVRGRSFYAIWDESQKLWSTDEYDVARLVDAELRAFAEDRAEPSSVKYMGSYGSSSWQKFQSYLSSLPDNAKQLDSRLVFADEEVGKYDYASKKLPYALSDSDCPGWDELISTLYSKDERKKIEWCIGSILAGDSAKIQKFLVFYGPAGTGKSTIINVIQKIFEGYCAVFDARALGSRSNAFAAASFRGNPLVAVQHDGDLSRIEDNTLLNSIIAHEPIVVNEKFKSEYSLEINAFLFMGTNSPVKISDSKSGLIRRLIDVQPTGKTLPPATYDRCMKQVQMELGAIAKRCRDLYLSLGRNFYDSYIPVEMMKKTESVFRFVSDNYEYFMENEYVTLAQAYAKYKEYAEENGETYVAKRYRFKDELMSYFENYEDRRQVENERLRSVYSGFDFNKVQPAQFDDTPRKAFDLKAERSVFDYRYKDCKAQYAKEDGSPEKVWDKVTTTLNDLDTSKLHYVLVPENHIVIDFDKKDENGKKSLKDNIVAATSWPDTYAEVSKSGEGLHLHYIYDGDPSKLSNVYTDDIEIKVYSGKASLRRKLTTCHNQSIAHISSGLPLKKERKMIHEKTIKSEKALRDLIDRNLRKEIHPGTKPSVDFIKHILDEAYESDLTYDVSDMKPAVFTFAAKSTNHALEMTKLVKTIHFQSKDVEAGEERKAADSLVNKLVFYDVEVFPNLFIVCWKFEGKDEQVYRMTNPTPNQIEDLMGLKLVGFNNRRYDNHILYGRFMGFNNEELYKLSQAIVNGNRNVMFGEAYGISYADVYDFSSKKQSLKKFEIELGLTHIENQYPWDEPLDKSHWEEVTNYCANDVLVTEAVFNARKEDFVAREILADLSGLTVNDTTQKHTAKIIFGNDREASKQFVYTDLSEMFPGYKYDAGVSTYRGEEVGEGGYVYSEPGQYENVALLDIASMHPTSIEQLNLFGKYTKNFSDLKAARIAIKHGDISHAKKMLDGKLTPYLEHGENQTALAYALKIVINIVYGLTSAKFDNPFRDIRNVDNIVAKRGALFMIDLKHAVQEKGFTVAHIKTDSIKIPNATPEIIKFVTDFGAKYGYTFEHEATYKTMCLVNDAVYIAKVEGGDWTAVGAQFQHPVVFKRLFTGEELTFDDYCETKSVAKGSIYLAQAEDQPIENMRFVGRVGRFYPARDDAAFHLYRVFEEKRYAVSGTKGYLWRPDLGDPEAQMKMVDTAYSDELVQKALDTINEFGNYEELIKNAK